SILKASSNAMTSSTVSRESAPRSSTKEASGVTSLASTPSCSTMMLLTFSSTLIPFLHFAQFGGGLFFLKEGERRKAKGERREIKDFFPLRPSPFALRRPRSG